MDDLQGLRVEDVVAIQAVIAKYGFMIDDRQFDRLGQVFTDDAYVDYRPGGTGPHIGLEEIEKQMHLLQHPIQHMLVNHMIDSVTADEVVVRSKALFPMRDGTIVDHAYRDVFVRTAAGWRIKRKTTFGYRG